jgi:F-type H+-transporting ATPase subunit delta
MDPVNRQSYAAAVERLDALATGGRPVPMAGVADDILATARLLTGEPRLRRALADPGRPGSDRADLLGTLLAGKVADDAADLLRVLVSGHWSSSVELLNATERLGVEALLASAESAGELAEVEDELFRFGQIVDGNPSLAAALGTSTVEPAQRAELVADLLRGRARSATIRLATVALEGLGGRNFANSLTRLVELAADRRDHSVAYVTVAVALTDADADRLAASLSRLTGREVAIKVSVDPTILGGMSVRIGADLFDGTIVRRLQKARADLAGTH